LARPKQPSINEQLKPETTLIRLFVHDTGLIDKISPRFRSAESAIIRCNRGTTPDDLSSDCVSAARLWQSIDELKNAQCKLFRPLLHFGFIHLY